MSDVKPPEGGEQTAAFVQTDDSTVEIASPVSPASKEEAPLENIDVLLKCLETKVEEDFDIYRLSALAKKRKAAAGEDGSTKGISSRTNSEVALNSVDLQQDDLEGSNSCGRNICANFFRPLVGLKRCKNKKTIPYNDPKTHELLSNIVYFCSKTHDFFAEQMIPSVESIAMKLYFPVGQIEADGLNVLSANVWTATFLIKAELKFLRDVDCDIIREQYVDLVWEVEKTHADITKYYGEFVDFQKRMLPGWKKIEKHAALDEGAFPLPLLEDPPEKKVVKGLYVKDELSLDQPIQLQASVKEDDWRKFPEYPYAFRSHTIIHLMRNVVLSLRTVQEFLVTSSLVVRGEKVVLDPEAYEPDSQLTCTRAVNIILSATKILTEEVVLPSEIKSEVIDWITNVAAEIRNFLGLTNWIVDKVDEIRDMIRLCYEFANQMYTLELPAYSSIVTEVSSEKLKEPSTISRVSSATKFIYGADLSASNQQLGHYNWQDFFCTEYHTVLQRLPISVGSASFLFLPVPYDVYTASPKAPEPSSVLQSDSEGFWDYYKGAK